MINRIREHRNLLVGAGVTIVGAALPWKPASGANPSELGILLLPGIVTLLAGLVFKFDPQSNQIAKPLILIGSGVIGLAAVASIVSSARTGEAFLAGPVIALGGVFIAVLGTIVPEP